MIWLDSTCLVMSVLDLDSPQTEHVHPDSDWYIMDITCSSIDPTTDRHIDIYVSLECLLSMFIGNMKSESILRFDIDTTVVTNITRMVGDMQ